MLGVLAKMGKERKSVFVAEGFVDANGISLANHECRALLDQSRRLNTCEKRQETLRRSFRKTKERGISLDEINKHDCTW